ncbi:MAG: SDR family NAD(P)-dependent oxidoreductase [Acidimicrobiia bacterium]
MVDRKQALVTGASTGIGRAIAVALAEAGFDVAITPRDLEPIASLDPVVALIAEAGTTALVVPLDLVDRSSAQRTAGVLLERWGGVDVLVHSARHLGPGHHDSLMGGEIADIERHIEGNFFTPLVLDRALVPAMTRRGGGLIVNLDSTAAYSDPIRPLGDGGWGLSYGASKAALHRSAGILAVELRAMNIACINVDPGTVRLEAIEPGPGRRGSDLDGPAAAAVGRACAWLASEPGEAMRHTGRTVFAQFLAHERGLVPGWRGPSRMPSRTARPDDAPAQFVANQAPRPEP